MLFLVLILHHYMGLTPGFLISRRSGGLQKGCFWYFGVSFARFDKFACQNGAAEATSTPPKCPFLFRFGGVVPPVGPLFLYSGVVGHLSP